ncbi:syntaxin-71-like [Solanum stenotomum]|uniref:syntaxin-71-like n=1 Tax=Solanum stenotomum TaxID=172797 RepID=UPI0020D02B85|nr:syntaxin-71-like [Solanum stenotomum]
MAGDDSFEAALYTAINSDIEAALQKEKNRASSVRINADILRIKARLIEDVPKLQRLAVKKVKGLSSKEFVVCNDLVLALPNRITAISDGAAATPKQSGGWGGSGSRAEIKFDLGYKVAFVPKAFPLHANHLSASMLYNSFIVMIRLSFLSIFGMDTKWTI